MDPTDSIKQSTLPTMWKHLSYPALIEFCKTSKEYSQLLEDPETWLHLLKRDFNLTSEPSEAKDYYELLYLVFPTFKYIDEPNNKTNQCVNCGMDKGEAMLKKYEDICFECWYENNRDELSKLNNDAIILNKLKKLVSEQPAEAQKCLLTFQDRSEISNLAIIKGRNIYDIILKVLMEYGLDHAAKRYGRQISLTTYIRDKIMEQRDEDQMGFLHNSFLKFLDLLHHDWIDPDDPCGYVISRIDKLRHIE